LTDLNRSTGWYPKKNPGKKKGGGKGGVTKCSANSVTLPTKKQEKRGEMERGGER